MAAVRLMLDDPGFLRFCTALGVERATAGAGPAARISIGQRADTCQVIHGLNRGGGWTADGALPDAEPGVTIFARHLAPVLCESPGMRDALIRVLDRDGVPGTFDPPLPVGPKQPVEPVPDPPPRKPNALGTLVRSELRWLGQGVRGVLRFPPFRFVTLMAGLAALLTWGLLRYPDLLCDAPAGATWLRSQVPAPGCGGATEINLVTSLPVVAARPSTGGPTSRPIRSPSGTQDVTSLGPLDRALSVLAVAGYDMSPALLAQHLATTGPVALDPALYLDAMLTRWPLPADQPIPRSKMGAMALVNFGLAVASLEGDRGAVTAIRERLAGMGVVLPGPVAVDGLLLPDLQVPADPEAPSLASLDWIDPRLARLAMDDVLLELSGLTVLLRGKSADPDLSGSAAPIDSNGTNIAAGVSSDALATYVAQIEARFGVSPGISPGQVEPVFLTDVVTTIRTSLEQQAPLDRSFESPLTPWQRELGLMPLAIPLLALLGAALGYPRALRRRLEHWPKPPLPGFHLVVPAPDRTPVLAPLARRVAHTLRHTPPRETVSLDVGACLSRLLRQGGYFTPVLRARRNIAAHVVLIHRRTLAEHEPRRIAALFGQLAAAGVSVALFEYAADPARVRPFGDLGGQTRDLSGLLQDYPEARLILVTSGDEFTGAGAYGVSAATLQTLLQWEHRAVVTPVPVGNWGLREWALSDRLQAPLARAGPDGLPDLAAIFPADPVRTPVAVQVAGPSPTGWLRKVIPRRAALDPIPPVPRLLAISEAEAAMPLAPRPDRLEAMALTLRRWLGPDGYLWLQACAFYPVLRYPLTRWLGSELFGPQASTRTLAQLTLLGWFAVGRMPTGVAARLRQGLGDVDRARIDAVFTRFYLTGQPDSASPAQDAGRGYHGERVAYERDTLATPVEMARLLPAAMTGDPNADDSRLRLARLAVLADRAAVVLAAGLLALVVWAVWPDRTALPLPPGAWAPVVVVGLIGGLLGVVALVTVAARRRLRRIGTRVGARGA